MGMENCEVYRLAKAIAPLMQADRRQIHAHPELGFEERETCALIRRRLDEIGIPWTAMADTGTVAQIDGGMGSGRCIALRADIDALPIQERTQLDYRSMNDGVMHACGHDGHAAILLGAARLLWEGRKQLRGSVRLIFQPAEEGKGGGRVMVEQGCLDGVDAALALHLETTVLQVGEAAFFSGYSHANTQKFCIQVRGFGGHGANPAKSIDPIVAAAQIVLGLQTVVSREVEPLDAQVLSIGSIHGGESWNAIASEVMLEGTLRSFSPELYREVPQRMERIIAGICAAHRCEYTFSLPFSLPSLYNDPSITQLMRSAADDVLGAEHVRMLDKPGMAGEDFSYFAQKVPVTMMALGARNEEMHCTYPLHHNQFNFDEQAMPIGTAILTLAAQRFLQEEAQA